MEPLHPELLERLRILRGRRGFDAVTYRDAKIRLLNDYARKTGISSLVIGVSGGIDSAVVLSLAFAASKVPGSHIKRVVGACLPYLKLKAGTTNQSEATSRGKEVIASVGAELMMIDLTESHKTLQSTIDKAAGAKGNAWASGQLVSYLRTPALYYITALLSQSGFPSIVLGTTNRDEGAYIGYFGKAADAMNDLQLISDIHKSEVYSLARLLGNIPDSVIQAIPTGDIYDGRTDEQLIGVPYDFIELHALCLSIAHPSEANFDFQDTHAQDQWDKYYDRVEQLHRENKHKYLGGSASLHFDVFPRAVLGGWRSQNEESDPPERPNAASIANLVSLDTACLSLVESNTLHAFNAKFKLPTRKFNLPGFSDNALQLDPILSEEECSEILKAIQARDWIPAGIDGMKLPTKDAPVGSSRMSFYSLSFANALWRRISPHMNAIRTFDEYCFTDFKQHALWRAVSVSPLFRVIKYDKGGYLIPHYDSPYEYSTSTKTLMSVVIYLTEQTDEKSGGRTRFILDRQRYLPQQERVYKDIMSKPQANEVLHTVAGSTGSVLIFDHRILHDCEELIGNEPKIILRTDIVFEQCGLATGEELYHSRPLGMPTGGNSGRGGANSSFKASLNRRRQKLANGSSKGFGGSKDANSSSHHALSLEGDRLYRKHLKDPFYSTVLAMTGRWDDVLNAGFFDDGAPGPDEVKNWKPQWEVLPLNWFSTPVFKIHQRLASLGLDQLSRSINASSNPTLPNKLDDKWLAVILSTGSFNPIHNGHLDMMEQGKQAVEAHGGVVIGGYLSPSHDLYVSSKLRKEALSARHRLHLCELATLKSDWLMADGWEALDLHYPVNFTDVIIHLERYLAAHIATHKPIHIVYVYGSDHAGFGLTFVQRGKAVCLHRPGSERKFEEFSRLEYFEEHNNVIFWQPPTLHVSSTEVRKGEKHGLMPDLALSEYRSLTSRLGRAPSDDHHDVITYHMRDEGPWAYQHFKNPLPSGLPQPASSSSETTSVPSNASLLGTAWMVFRMSIQAAIQSAHWHALPPDQKRTVKFVVSGLSEQQVAFQKLLKSVHERGYKILSLDAALEGDESLFVSRCFSLSTGAQIPKLSHRPGYPSIQEQILRLSPGNYVLFDDDSYTGFTFNQIRKELSALRSSDITIVENVTLYGDSLDHHDDENEMVDLRDFLMGAHQGGLVVSSGDGHLARAPYVLPYVSPRQRASIPLSKELTFSIAIWEANVAFFEQISTLPISSLDPATMALLHSIGFEETTSALEAAKWHLNHLRENWEAQNGSRQRPF
jgi:NAD+ synthetase